MNWDEFPGPPRMDKEVDMSLINRILPTGQKTRPTSTPFLEEFKKNINRDDHPYQLALKSIAQLEKTGENPEEVFLYLLEDIIFASLYATFYEQLLFTARENSHLACELIEVFANDQKNREQIIAEQAQLHYDYILNNGTCQGCVACENHADVADLLEYFNKGDYSFFRTLYIGMQTIQYAMEELIYDRLPEHIDWTKFLTADNILEFRQFIIEFVEEKQT